MAPAILLVALLAGVVVVVAEETKDRFGLGYRPELSALILYHKDQFDILEVIMDDYFTNKFRNQKELVFLSSQFKLLFHGVTLGICSSFPLPNKILDSIRKLTKSISIEYWSEHFSFVRAGSIEIGHLCAPPYTKQSIESTIHNLEIVEKKIGSIPLLENISTLIYPPGSKMTEIEWIRSILEKTNINILLDLHNLYSNSTNFGYSATDFISSIPPNRIKQIHIAGGKIVYYRKHSRILDDHKHRVPQEVWKYLEFIGSYCKQPLDIILEWDSNFPEFNILLEEIQLAKTYLTKGRNANRRKII